MWLFAVYCIVFSVIIYKWKFIEHKHFVFTVFILKAFFIAIITYTRAGEWAFFKVPDEDNYYHDILLFHEFAIHHPVSYLQFLLDIEPTDNEVFNAYFTHTNAWYKAPEFFYNDNRWVIKIHSVLSFFSGGYLSVHRLFSAVLSVLSWLLLFKFTSKIFVIEKFPYSGWIFLISSLFPAFFFFTEFILKESILIFFMGVVSEIILNLMVEKKHIVFNAVWMIVMLLITLTFRPVYLLPFIGFTGLFLFVKFYVHKHKSIVFVSAVLMICLFVYTVFLLGLKKNVFSIIQYRQERFLDASKGGIFLLNTKKFVRVPYDWNNLIIDSSQRITTYRIKKNVPVMYWYLTNLNDTIVEKNQNIYEEYHLLYYIERANRTVYIEPFNTQKSLKHNLKGIAQAVSVFFFYPLSIKGFMDVVVWFENILILFLLFVLIYCVRYNSLTALYVLMFVTYLILIISITSPNTGAIIRYRFFILPFIFIIIANIFLNKTRKKL